MAEGSLPVAVPANLKPVSDEDLQGMFDALKERGAALKAEPTVTPELVQETYQVRDDYQRVKAEINGRQVTREEAAAAEARRMEKARADALDDVIDQTEPTDGDAGPAADGNGHRQAAQIDPEAIAAASARGTVAALASIGVKFPNGMKPDEAAGRATNALAAAAIRTNPRTAQLPERRLAVTAGVDIPGVATGGELSTVGDLVSAIQKRAKAMPTTRDGDNARGAIVASVRKEYEQVVDERNTPQEVADLLDEMRSETAKEALLAGGGWCAPSQISYDFFNIADPPDGLIDLPTVGINRGGLRYPVSPSIADAFAGSSGATTGLGGFAATFAVTSVPFLYSETDDIATVTGSPNKPVLRVPCASFAEQRLECYGVNVTAGNLTDDAWPEQTRNFLRLVMAAHEHIMNARLIALMVAGSSSAITTGSFAVSGNPVFNQVVGGMALAALDYRTRYAMNDGAVLEAVAPKWLLGAIVADLAWRAGTASTDMLSVTRAQIDGFLADRGVRVQWVDDYQVRGTGLPGVSGGLTAWPRTADFLMYAAGTFVRGDGMTLDLGIIRDSVLNAENDFTVAFTEECHLVAKVGHESRRYTVQFGVNGASPAAVAAGSYV